MKKLLIFSSRIPEYDSKKAASFFVLLKAMVLDLEVHYLSFQSLFLDERTIGEMENIGVKIKSLQESKHAQSFDKRLAMFLGDNKYDFIMFDSVYTAKYYLPQLRKYSNDSVLFMDARSSQYLMELKFVASYKDESKKSTILAKSKITAEKELPIYSYFDAILVDNQSQKEAILKELPNINTAIIDLARANNENTFKVKNVFKSSAKKKEDIDERIKATKLVYMDFSDQSALISAYNKELKNCKQDYIVIVPENSVMPDYFMKALHDCMASHPRNMLVAPASNVYISKGAKGSIPEPEDEGDFAEFLDKHQIGNFAEWRNIVSVVEPVFMLRVAAVRKIGLLDNNFDKLLSALFDYSFRVKQADYRLILNQESFIYYRDPEDVASTYSQKDQKLLSKKWGLSGAEILESLGA